MSMDNGQLVGIRDVLLTANSNNLTWMHFYSMRLTTGIVTIVLMAASMGCSHSKKLRRALLEVEMIAIEGGSYTMGDVFEYENIDATPVHPVTVGDFKIARTEVTYGQYDAFAEAKGWALPPDDSLGRGSRAVVYVTWDEAAAFCDAYGYRLPTEEEWEFAARERGKRLLYSGTNDEAAADAYVSYDRNTRPDQTIVASRKPNALGLFDMSGNVFEWVADYYAFYPNPEDEPVFEDLETNNMRVLRGGSFNSPLDAARTYWRSGTLRSIRSASVGFRCASD